MGQSYERWLGPPEVAEPLDSVTVAAFGNTSAVLLVVTGDGTLVKITFESSFAVASQDEFAHWLMDEPDGGIPLLDAGGAYPYLRVVNSTWATGLSEVRRLPEQHHPTHYLIITLNNHVDVLSYHEPVVELVSSDSWEHFFGRVAP